MPTPAAADPEAPLDLPLPPDREPAARRRRVPRRSSRLLFESALIVLSVLLAYTQGMSSLEHEHQGHTVAEWMMRFVAHGRTGLDD